MRIPVWLRIVVLTVAVTGFYTYVGQMVPQKEVHPPEEIVLDMTMSPAEMVAVGEGIAAGKGMCLTCHGLSRYPDLAGISSRAATTIEGMGQIAYLANSLYHPDDYIVEGFSPGMPVIDKAPIGLSDDEIKTVIAWLQSLGGEPTVTMDTDILAEMSGGGEGS